MQLHAFKWKNKHLTKMSVNMNPEPIVIRLGPQVFTSNARQPGYMDVNFYHLVISILFPVEKGMVVPLCMYQT